MDSHASDPAASSPNGLKLFPRPKRSRTNLNELGPSSGSERNQKPLSLEVPPASSHGNGESHSAPTGLAKLIPGAKRRQRKKASGGNDDNFTDLNSEYSGESRVSLPHSGVNGSLRRAMTHAGSDLADDDSDYEDSSSRGSRRMAENEPARSPLITVSDSSLREGVSNPNQEKLAPDSEVSSSNLRISRSSTAAVDDSRSSTKGTVGSSTGRKLREAFSPRASNRSSNPSPDRESSRSSGSKSGKGLLSSAGRRTSLSSKRAQKPSEESLPPVPALPNPPDSDAAQRPRPTIDTTPSTPPPGTRPSPVTTTVTPPTPTLPHHFVESPEQVKPSNGIPENAVLSPSGNMISHRRVRSASSAHNPSKLSNSMTLPITPIDENAVSGSRSSTAAGGFFSSMFSAAQNAASTLSIGLNQGKPRTGPEAGAEKQADSAQLGGESQFPSSQDDNQEKKELAIDTLGTGNLDFSHLGIDTSSGGMAATQDEVASIKPEQPGRSRTSTVSQRDEMAARIEDLRAARAVSMAYEKPPNSATLPLPPNENNAPEHRHSVSLNNLGRSNGGDFTPPTASIIDGDFSEDIKRSGSLRSGHSVRRKRGSSAATANTIGALGAALGASPSIRRRTGFAVASKKRNRDFHTLFRSVPEDDYLIEDYSCALQREIILAGRIYISEGHICFSSNILGWVTTLVLGFDEIVAIEKESTAMVFPNAISIHTLHARHIFRSLLSRDASYDLMVNIWKSNHPTLKSSVNGRQVNDGTGDKTEKAEFSDGDDESFSDEEEEVYDEDEEDQANTIEAPDSIASDISDLSKPLMRKSSTIPVSAALSSQALAPGPGEESKSSTKTGSPVESPAQFPGPKTHAPTEFTDPSGRYEKVVKDETIPAPLGQVYALVFGPASCSFIPNFLSELEKVAELQFDDKKGLTEENKVRSYTYIKPLNSSLGPKQTKCITTEQLDLLDFEKAVLVTLTTQTPDVPSGNVFSVKTKYLLTWAPGNATRFYMSCAVEWTGKSWIKVPIEKGANDGQLGYGNNLIKALKAGVGPKMRKPVPKGATKGKSKRARLNTSEELNGIENQSKRAKSASWGVFEPLRPLSPIVDTVYSFWSSNVAVVVLCSLLFMMWFRTPPPPHARSPGSALQHLSLPERLIAYDELWAKEESDLWDWLEERVGMEGLTIPVANTRQQPVNQQRLRGVKDAEAQLRDEKMSEREITEAIRVTQQRLETLQQVIEERRVNRVQAENSGS